MIAESREVPDEDAGFIDPGQKALHASCTGGKEVGDLLREGPGRPERIRRILYAFVSLGLVTLGEPQKVAPAPAPTR